MVFEEGGHAFDELTLPSEGWWFEFDEDELTLGAGCFVLCCCMGERAGCFVIYCCFGLDEEGFEGLETAGLGCLTGLEGLETGELVGLGAARTAGLEGAVLVGLLGILFF